MYTRMNYENVYKDTHNFCIPVCIHTYNICIDIVPPSFLPLYVAFSFDTKNVSLV